MTKAKSCKFEKNIYVEQRCGAYRFVVAVHPLPKDSATFSTREEGAKWARRRRLELLDQKAAPAGATPDLLPVARAIQPRVETEHLVQPGAIPLSKIFDSFEEFNLSKLAGEQAEASRLRRLRGWFAEKTLDELDDQTLDEWRKRRLSGILGSGRNPNRGAPSGQQKPLTKHQRYSREKSGKAVSQKQIYPVSSQTVRHEIVLMRRAVHAYFKQNRLLPHNALWLQEHALMRMELPEKAAPRDRRLSDHEILSIVSELGSTTLKSAVQFALLTTLRCAEIVSLRWEDVNLDRRVVLLRRPGHLKKSKTHERRVPLMPDAITLLKALVPQKTGPVFPISASGLSQGWRRAADAAGFHDARLHDCRRESISRLIENFDLPLEKVVVFSGHADLTTLQRHYVRLNPELIAAQLAKSFGT